MVKPALAYMDVILAGETGHQPACRGLTNVSGEYSMVKAAALNGWVDGAENRDGKTMTSFKRSGADFIPHLPRQGCSSLAGGLKSPT